MPTTPPPMVEPRAVVPPVAGTAMESARAAASRPAPGRAASAKGKVLVSLAAAVVVGVLTGIVLFVTVGRSSRKAPPGPVARPVTAPPDEEAARPSSVPLVVPTPAEAPVPETRRIQITVHPAHASLSLDDEAVTGNVIRLDVPPARTAHVVRANAPGYLAFRRTITYANDLVLEVRLKKAEAPDTGDSAISSTAQGPPAFARNDGKPDGKPDTKSPARPDTKPVPVTTPGEEYGMDLQRPMLRRPTKKIDETDPYAP